MPTVRDLRSIAQNRIILWWLLAFSGIPLYLLCNSAVFSTLASQEYSVYIPSDELISEISINWTATDPQVGLTPADTYRITSQWQNLPNKECMQAYGQSLVTTRSDLLAITSSLNASGPIRFVANASIGLAIDESGPAYLWLCSAYPNVRGTYGCDLKGLSRYSSNWDLAATLELTTDSAPESSPCPIQYCLSKTIEKHCRLQLSLTIMCIVMFCNFKKALCMYLILRHQNAPPLVTLGDAIESFLQDRDWTTKNMCLADKYTFAAN